MNNVLPSSDFRILRLTYLSLICSPLWFLQSDFAKYPKLFLLFHIPELVQSGLFQHCCECFGVVLWFLQFIISLVILRLSNFRSWFIIDFWFFPSFQYGFPSIDINSPYNRLHPLFPKTIVSIIQYYSWTIHEFMIALHLLHMISLVCNPHKWMLWYQLISKSYCCIWKLIQKLSHKLGTRVSSKQKTSLLENLFSKLTSFTQTII